MTTLHTLRDRLAAATGPDRQTDIDIWHAFFEFNERLPGTMLDYTSSIDAAITLVGWLLGDVGGDARWHSTAGCQFNLGHGWASAKTLPLAILRALVEALIARETDNAL